MWRNGFQRKLVGGAAQSLAKIIVACAVITGAMNGTTLACPKGNDSVASPVVAIRQNALEIITAIVSAGGDAIKANDAPTAQMSDVLADVTVRLLDAAAAPRA